jgi:hypothetical protein
VRKYVKRIRAVAAVAVLRYQYIGSVLEEIGDEQLSEWYVNNLDPRRKPIRPNGSLSKAYWSITGKPTADNHIG